MGRYTVTMLVRSTEREHHLCVGYGWQPYPFLSRLYLRFSALCGEMDIYERIIDANAHMCECVCLPHSLPLSPCVCQGLWHIFYDFTPFAGLLVDSKGHSQCG